MAATNTDSMISAKRSERILIDRLVKTIRTNGKPVRIKSTESIRNGQNSFRSRNETESKGKHAAHILDLEVARVVFDIVPCECIEDLYKLQLTMADILSSDENLEFVEPKVNLSDHRKWASCINKSFLKDVYIKDEQVALRARRQAEFICSKRDLLGHLLFVAFREFYRRLKISVSSFGSTRVWLDRYDIVQYEIEIPRSVKTKSKPKIELILIDDDQQDSASSSSPLLQEPIYLQINKKINQTENKEEENYIVYDKNKEELVYGKDNQYYIIGSRGGVYKAIYRYGSNTKTYLSPNDIYDVFDDKDINKIKIKSQKRYDLIINKASSFRQ